MEQASNPARRNLLIGGGALAAMHAGPARPAATRARSPRGFVPDAFIEECQHAAANPVDSQAAIRELLARELSDTGAVLQGLGTPTKGGLATLYRSPTLTILNIVWAPLMQLLPHDHNMWALIGIYTGREDNIFWQRGDSRLRAVTASAIAAGDVVALPRDVIHSVNNPLEKLTGAIHIYGGDFFGVHRSEWDPATLTEQDWNIKTAVRTFERANQRFYGAPAADCRRSE